VTDTATSAAPATSAPQPLDVATLPRAGFWIRLAASLIDVVLISILFSMLGLDGFPGHADRAVILRDHAYQNVHVHLGVFSGTWPTLIFLAYLAALWAWRGTTIGGIIFGLKAVRTNGQPLGWAVAIVRVLASLLSLAVVGLGFFWIAWDREKQAWHDKIAGTLVVRMPKGVSLI